MLAKKRAVNGTTNIVIHSVGSKRKERERGGKGGNLASRGLLGVGLGISGRVAEGNG